MLRTRTSRREEPLDAERPIVRADRATPSRSCMLADSVGLALLVVLDKLEPAERLAFVLHDLFGMPFDEIAPIVARTPDATRQLASRARRRVQGSPPPDDRPRGPAPRRRDVHRGAAARRRRGPDRRPRSRGRRPRDRRQGNVREVRGARTWASGAVAFAQARERTWRRALIDGAVGLVMAPKGRLFRALRFTFEGGRIAPAEIIADRARLDALEIAALDYPTSVPAG